MYLTLNKETIIKSFILILYLHFKVYNIKLIIDKNITFFCTVVNIWPYIKSLMVYNVCTTKYYSKFC
jgi:hypothetical protein